MFFIILVSTLTISQVMGDYYYTISVSGKFPNNPGWYFYALDMKNNLYPSIPQLEGLIYFQLRCPYRWVSEVGIQEIYQWIDSDNGGAFVTINTNPNAVVEYGDGTQSFYRGIYTPSDISYDTRYSTTLVLKLIYVELGMINTRWIVIY